MFDFPFEVGVWVCAVTIACYATWRWILPRKSLRTQGNAKAGYTAKRVHVTEKDRWLEACAGESDNWLIERQSWLHKPSLNDPEV